MKADKGDEGAKAVVIMQRKMEGTGEEQHQDSRIGKRVICRSLLPTFTLLGTVQSIDQYNNGMEYWNVLTDGLMIDEGPASSFVFYEGPEFQAGEQVKYRIDAGGYWLATVVEPRWMFDHLRFLIRVENSEHAEVKVEQGRMFAAEPARLSPL